MIGLPISPGKRDCLEKGRDIIARFEDHLPRGTYRGKHGRKAWRNRREMGGTNFRGETKGYKDVMVAAHTRNKYQKRGDSGP